MALSTYAGFLNAGFLRAEGARALNEDPRNVRMDAEAVVTWFKELTYDRPARFLRAYWYDAKFEDHHEHADGQGRFFAALGLTPGIQMRLGQIVEQRPWFEQSIREAIRRTAQATGQDPDDLMNEFDRQWTFRPERRQRGVDTLIATDLVRLAGRRVYDTAVIISGDRDLTEAVRAVQEFGARVMIASPDRHSVARDLMDLADEFIEIDEGDLNLILPERLP